MCRPCAIPYHTNVAHSRALARTLSPSRKKKRSKKSLLKDFEEELESVRSTFNDEEDLRLQRKQERELAQNAAHRQHLAELAAQAKARETDSMLKIVSSVLPTGRR